MATTYHLFDDIWGGTLGQLADAIAEAKAGDGELTVKINSYGGDVMVGWAAANLLRASGLKITADVLGLCASAATYILLACPTRRMSANATIMIHEAEAFAAGRAEDLALTAEQVERCNTQMVELYSTATSLTGEQARAAMKATTYYSAEQAKTLGFVQETYAAVDAASRVLIAASLMRQAPIREAALAAAKEHMTVDELITAVKALSAEDQAKFNESVAPPPAATTEESNLGEAVVKLAGVEASAALGVVLAWKTNAETKAPAVDKGKALVEALAKPEYAKRLTPALKAEITKRYEADEIGIPGVEAWLKHSPEVIAPAPVRAAGVNPEPTASGSGSGPDVKYEGMTYAELLATAPIKLAALKRDNPELFNSLRVSAG